MTKETGHVKWFDDKKGYGFIKRQNGDDVFVHYRSIIGTGRRTLRENDQVEFSLRQGDKGLQAEEVIIVNQSHDDDSN